MTVPAVIAPGPAVLAVVPDGGGGALAAFGLYLAGVGVLAWLSNRGPHGRSFVSEYFLGSRNFGMWAFALTFAATTASGGTFMGFPSLVYTHGWSLALWIASYMVVPLMGLVLLGKRLNQMARRARALTIPELLEERFGNRAVGSVATLLLVVFMFFYLLAQFKAGSKILSTLLADVDAFQACVRVAGAWADGIPWVGSADPDYLVCLVVFAAAVIAYVVYGGFRAVVWTDVMQGFVMFGGVIVMLVLVLVQTGGLEKATRALARQVPPESATAILRAEGPVERPLAVPRGTWLRDSTGALVKTVEPATIPAGGDATPATRVLRMVGEPAVVPAVRDDAATPLAVEVVEVRPAAYGAGRAGVYTSLPGPSRDSDLGFLTLGTAISFFIFWAFGTAGQPSNMVRLMVFRDTQTFRRAIVTVSVYFTLIYFLLVVIFCCGRVLLPGLDDDSDRVMPELAAHLTAAAGVPWLGGFLLAAPFAAVMSSVDSFLLVVSSSLVRDLYQRRMHPDASEKRIRALSYWVTAVVGVAAVLAVLNPPRYLQDLIVFASGGVAGCFLVPVFLTLYWERFNGPGAVAGMLGGFVAHAVLTILGYLESGSFAAYELLGIQPFVWDLIGSTVAAVAATLATSPPDSGIVDRFFRES